MKDESEEIVTLDLLPIGVHLLTCPARAAACAATLARWDATDWGKRCGRPRLHIDERPEAPEAPWGDAQRGSRIVDAFRTMLAMAVYDSPVPPTGATEDVAEGWILLLEDDLDFHPRIAAAVESWEALAGATMASLFNPGLREIKTIADGQLDSEGPPATAPYLPPAVRLLQFVRRFSADPRTFLGAQALLLRVPFARVALDRWDSVTGMQSQRLAKLHEEFYAPLPISVHRPSLVQHLPVAGGSGWGARVQQALDFDPAWRPEAL